MKKLEDLDIQPVYMGSKETRAWLDQDVRKFIGVVKGAGLSPTN